MSTWPARARARLQRAGFSGYTSTTFVVLVLFGYMAWATLGCCCDIDLDLGIAIGIGEFLIQQLTHLLGYSTPLGKLANFFARIFDTDALPFFSDRSALHKNDVPLNEIFVRRIIVFCTCVDVPFLHGYIVRALQRSIPLLLQVSAIPPGRVVVGSHTWQGNIRV